MFGIPLTRVWEGSFSYAQGCGVCLELPLRQMGVVWRNLQVFRDSDGANLFSSGLSRQ
jgi:hypothetical protein